MKLRLGIQQVGGVVFGRVLEQDESLFGKGTLADGGSEVLSIESVAAPSLSTCNGKGLFVRGNCPGSDNSWFAWTYLNTSTAIQAVKDIRMLVAKVNAVEHQDEPDTCGLEIIE